MSDSSLPDIDIQRQRKNAKRLLRAFRSGDAGAIDRFLTHLPRLRGLSAAQAARTSVALNEAQWVVAREAGFTSWPRMKQAASYADRQAAVLEAAVSGDEFRVLEFLHAAADLPRRSLPIACALGHARAATEWIANDPTVATTNPGPSGWTPLLYCCHARFGNDRREIVEARVEIARLLLEHGANPNDSRVDRTVDAGHRSALAGATGIVGSAALARVLIDHGARPHDVTAMIGAATRDDPTGHDRLGCLRLMLSHQPPRWHIHPALTERVRQDDVDAVRLLLDHGADPDHSGGWGRSGTTLHLAVLSGCSAEMIDLLADRADLARRDRDGRTAFAVANRVGHRAAIQRLRAAGAVDSELNDIDRRIAAFVRGDDAEGGSSPSDYRRGDHQMLAWAIRRGRLDAALRLLELGLDPSVPDDDGRPPLHLAAAAGDAELVTKLLAAGAPCNARDLRGRTAIDSALANPDAGARARVVEALLTAGAAAAGAITFPCGDASIDDRLRRAGAVERDDLDATFEDAAQAVVDGDRLALAELLADHPELALARSPRAHRATLLHYLGANGVEQERQKTPSNALEIAAMLLDAGAEPDALCATYGGGPAQTTLSLLASSDWPERAGLQGDLVELLVRRGARADGIDDDGVPLATAIAFRKPDAVAALARHARLDNVAFAAAAGRLDLLRIMVDQQGRATSRSRRCGVPWLGLPTDPAAVAGHALIRAAQFGHASLVEWLLERSVDVHAATREQITAIHEASYLGHADVVELLIRYGADPGRRDAAFDSTAIGWAQGGDRPEVIEAILRHHRPDILDAAELGMVDRAVELIAADPSLLHGPDGTGAPLRIATWHGHRELIEVLLQAGADPARRNRQGQDAIDVARERGFTDLVTRLDGARRDSHL